MGAREDLLVALKAADDAGNVDDAKKIAAKISLLGEPLTDYSRKIIEQGSKLSQRQLLADRGLAASQGASLGWSDELLGLVGGLDAMVRGPNAKHGGNSFGEGYSNTVRDARSDLAEYQKQRPLEALGVEAAGGLPLAGIGGSVIKGPLASRALRAAGVGSGIGAVSGAGNADEGNREEGTAIGGLAGAGLGVVAPLIPSAVKGVTRLVSRGIMPAKKFALNYLSQMIDPATQPVVGKVLAQVGGPKAVEAAEQSALSGDGRQVATNFFEGKDKTREGDLISSIRKTINDKPLYDAFDSLNEQRMVDAKPLYLDAYKAGYRRTPRLLDLSKRPATGAAARAAMTRVLNDPDINPDEFRAAMEPVFGNNIDDLSDTQLQQRLTQALGSRPLEFKVLDYIKRGLDNVVNDNKSSSEVRRLRNAWREELKTVNPAYSKALNAWAGPSRSIDALEEGRNFMQQDPEAIDRLMAEMGDSERQSYQIGVSRALQDMASGTGKTPGQVTSLSLAKGIQGNTIMQRRLQAALGPNGAGPETILQRSGWKPSAGGAYVNPAKPGQVLQLDQNNGTWSLVQTSKSGRSTSMVNAGHGTQSLEQALTGLTSSPAPGPQSVDDLINVASDIVDTANKKAAIIGNSATARRMAGADEFNPLGELAGGVVALKAGHGGAFAHAMGKVWGRMSTGLTDSRRAAVANMLFSDDPIQQQNALDEMQRIRSGKKPLYSPGALPAISGELVGPPSSKNN